MMWHQLQVLYPTEHLPSRITFQVGATHVLTPQTNHNWYFEMDHEMGGLEHYSLVPEESKTEFVSHYHVVNERPRLIGDPQFSDAWITTHHGVHTTPAGLELHFSRTLFNPVRTPRDEEWCFTRQPKTRLEVVAPGRFIEDREVLEALAVSGVATESEIRSLLQRRP